MPRARGTKQYQPLTLGLITEASPLEFPQGATVDERNFLFEHNGNRRVKRKGLNTRRTLDYTLQHNIDTPISVRLGSPFFWRAYDLVILPLIVEEPTFTRVEFHFYDNTGTFLNSFFSSTDIANPVNDVTFDEFDAAVLKVDDQRLVLNVNFNSNMYFVDIDESSGNTEVVCTQGSIYYRDFATLTTDDDPYVRKTITDGTAPVDVNYEYNVTNSGWYKNYPSRSPSASSPLQSILLAWSADNSIQYPAMSDNVNSYIQRDENNGDLIFDTDLYKIGEPRGFLAPRGSQVINNDGVLGGRDVDDPTYAPAKLSEILRFSI
ncbi:hypothetical protein NVP1208B_12 [Vibrio phage 1.208.B._10N.222.52.A7]|nr:hypothetical protein NVP1208B_12 [Vibrio phage 1.208.B._10N.222.52.A7]